MKIFQIDTNRFAIGFEGEPAAFVADVTGRPGHGGKIRGVRGVKPVLNERFPLARKVNKALIKYLEARV